MTERSFSITITVAATPDQAFAAINGGRRFPCIALAYAAMRARGSAPAVLNAANESAVEAFLDGRIGFLDIARVLRRVLDGHHRRDLESAADVWEADREARSLARSML